MKAGNCENLCTSQNIFWTTVFIDGIWMNGECKGKRHSKHNFKNGDRDFTDMWEILKRRMRKTHDANEWVKGDCN